MRDLGFRVWGSSVGSLQERQSATYCGMSAELRIEQVWVCGGAGCFFWGSVGDLLGSIWEFWSVDVVFRPCALGSQCKLSRLYDTKKRGRCSNRLETVDS